MVEVQDWYVLEFLVQVEVGFVVLVLVGLELLVQIQIAHGFQSKQGFVGHVQQKLWFQKGWIEEA